MSGFRLILLACTQCGAPLAAEADDVVYYCTACRSGFTVDETSGGLTRVETSFVSLPHGVAARYLPFWLLPARVEITHREGGGGGLQRIASALFGGSAEAPTSTSAFLIPAFEAPLAQATALASRYSQSAPNLGELLAERLTGGRYGVEDAKKLAHHTLIAAEADRPDTLKDLAYRIDFGPARLLGVPFVRRGDVLVDALFGLPAGRG